MGQKVHPVGFRLGITHSWSSTWYGERRDYVRGVRLDHAIRKKLLTTYPEARIGQIEIKRTLDPRKGDPLDIVIHAARQGHLIGKKAEYDKRMGDLRTIVLDIARAQGVVLDDRNLSIHISEIKNPELDASLVAADIADQISRRIMYRRAVRRAIAGAMQSKALGIKVRVSGRLNDAEIARSDWFREGRIPLHTLRADIDYGFATARTTYGTIGFKVWIFNGEERVRASAPALEAMG